MLCQLAGNPAFQRLKSSRRDSVLAFSRVKHTIRSYLGKTGSTILCSPCCATSINVQEPNEPEPLDIRQETYVLSADECKLVDDVVVILEQHGSDLSDLLAAKISPKSRLKLLTALSDEHLKAEKMKLQEDEGAAQAFKTADVNSDGLLNQHEFEAYYNARVLSQNRPLNLQQLLLIASADVLNMAGFGFTDTVILLLSGDLIEQMLGESLGITTLAACGLGGIVSSLMGIAFGSSLEVAVRSVLPPVNASEQQLSSRAAQIASSLGSMLGIFLGSVLGIMPLFLQGKVFKKLKEEAPTPGGAVPAVQLMDSSSNDGVYGIEAAYCSIVPSVSGSITPLQQTTVVPTRSGSLWSPGGVTILSALVTVVLLHFFRTFRKQIGTQRCKI